MSSNVLFVDDDTAASQSLIRSLKRHGVNFEAHHAATATQAKSLAATLSAEVAVVDLSLDPQIGPPSGLALISDLLVLDPTIRVLVLTGHGSEEFGIQALQYGAASFLVKPVEPSHILSLIRDGISYSSLQRAFRRINESPGQFSKLSGLESNSPAMQAALESVALAATNSQPVLLAGETGTGKGVIAQAIHRADAAHKGSFIRFQPSFSNHDLTSSELFGHKKGSFTGATEDKSGLVEEADDGTLFIDEVDELPHETQILLLNVLQEHLFRRVGETKERRSHFRLIAATNRPVDEIRKVKKLRDDFYHRIAHFTIEIPPLRDRSEDIESLAMEFLVTISNRDNLSVQGFTAQAIARLTSYHFPGNVRELQAKVEGAVYRAHFHRRRMIEPADLGIDPKGKKSSPGSGLSFRERVSQYELQLVEEALLKHNNNQTNAAASLQLDRTTLRRILERSD